MAEKSARDRKEIQSPEMKRRLFRYFKEQILKGKDSVDFTGRLMLLIKNEDKPASNNNRPIAISSNIVKIFE